MYEGSRKKQRGQKRKLEKMFSYIDCFEPCWNQDVLYEHFHVPSDPFIERAKTSNQAKRSFYQKWLSTTKKFIEEKPQDLKFCKIVALLSIPNLWSSEIIIFFDKSYYESFFERHDDYQKWILIENDSFAKRQSLNIDLCEMGIRQFINDEGDIFTNELWFYGEVVEFIS
ncbi:DUF3916 domain-containing protein [Longibaculum muris]|uniref:DUF3916 domain-containing protein n=1 Tax=Longibaculum muris TaxID=1796628 RepID=UPI0018A0FC42|nr:DUF3916 domain-containing protein [Longibaculum muris]